MEGGAGADIFAFGDFGGIDLVSDFAAGVDRLDFSGASGVTGMSDLSLVDDADGVTIGYLGSAVMLEGVFLSDLDANDFIF